MSIEMTIFVTGLFVGMAVMYCLIGIRDNMDDL